ncbi:MAG: sulfurtransferase TusA family protein [Candidatus Hydrothermota bacterium]|nr:MAG: sulfurtransferase TusA family protein [Candidatus Hydrothermae bacterium]
MEVAKTLDTRGMLCPMPIIKTKKVIQELQPGEILEVIADDPGAKEDFPAWCEQTGNELLKLEEKENGDIYVYIKKR